MPPRKRPARGAAAAARKTPTRSTRRSSAAASAIAELETPEAEVEVPETEVETNASVGDAAPSAVQAEGAPVPSAVQEEDAVATPPPPVEEKDTFPSVELSDSVPPQKSEQSEPSVAEPEASPAKPVVDEEKPAAVEEKPAAVKEKPAAVEVKPEAVAEKQVAIEEKPAAVEEKPAVVEEKPAAASGKKTVTRVRRVVKRKVPSSSHATPVNEASPEPGTATPDSEKLVMGGGKEESADASTVASPLTISGVSPRTKAKGSEITPESPPSQVRVFETRELTPSRQSLHTIEAAETQGSTPITETTGSASAEGSVTDSGHKPVGEKPKKIVKRIVKRIVKKKASPAPVVKTPILQEAKVVPEESPQAEVQEQKVVAQEQEPMPLDTPAADVDMMDVHDADLRAAEEMTTTEPEAAISETASESASKPLAEKKKVVVRKVIKKVIVKKVPKCTKKEEQKVEMKPDPSPVLVSVTPVIAIEKQASMQSTCLENSEQDVTVGASALSNEDPTDKDAGPEEESPETIDEDDHEETVEEKDNREIMPPMTLGIMDEQAAISERQRRRKTEIFIGGLDRDAKEEDIKKVFCKAGEIVEVRMMMDGQTGKNKGYAFLRYASSAQAKHAVSEFAKVEICGKLCGAAALEGNDTIFLGNIDKKWKNDDLLKLLQEIDIEKIDTVTVMPHPSNSDLNRGFAFLELETNKDAQIAYKKLQKKGAFGKDQNIKVSWATPLNDPDDEDMQKVKSVYAEGVPSSWSEDNLKAHFSKFGDIERVVLARNIQSAKRKDFAFVNYTTREAAVSCIDSFDKEDVIDKGSKVNIKVSFAKPLQKGKQKKGTSKPKNKDSAKDKMKAVQKSQKVNTPNKVHAHKGNHVSNSGERRLSTTQGHLHAFREQASRNEEQIGRPRGPAIQDYPYGFRGEKRPFSALGDSTLYSDPRGYPRARIDSSYPAASPSSFSSSVSRQTFPYYPRPNVGYAAGAHYGAADPSIGHQARYGNPSYGSSRYPRY